MPGLIGLLVSGFYFRNALNTDAVSYLRIASYYANGQWHLAVSGYWGPLASWLMAPLLKVGLSPLIAARLFMGFSVVVFVAGCVAVYRAFALPTQWVRAGAVLAACAGLYWSLQFITPDLLLSGIIGFAASRLFGEHPPRSDSAAAKTGVIWGLAYLTKAAAFPLAIFAFLAWGALNVLKPSVRRGLALRELGWVVLGFSLLA